MKRLIGLIVLTLFVVNCAAGGMVRTVQVSHDWLALAQDYEAQLCWGVPNVQSGPADRTHCTAPTAATVKLTDARHQELNKQLVLAFNLNAAAAKQLKAGQNADLTPLSQTVALALTLIAQLDAGNLIVTQLKSAVTHAQVK